MRRPQITETEARVFLKDEDPEEFYPVFLMGLRGYYKNTMGEIGENDRGIYDDCICLFAPGYFKTFNANTDPSIYRKGIATLKPGVHIYKKGKHGISRPGGGYPALRPATLGEKLPVTRDGQKGDLYGIAINIHKGGIKTTSSEGCQTIHPEQWNDFIDNVYKRMTAAKQSKIPYILTEI